MGVGAGCASRPGSQLTVTPAGLAAQSFTQTFTNAYCSQDADGDTDIVLLDDASARILDGDRNDAPVRHVLHLRVLWKPTRDSKADHTSASNATFHWYVMGNAPAAGGVLEYAGTAMVVLEPGERGTELAIRSASMRPVASRGAIQDPIGPASLRGSIRATESLERVRLALTSVRRAVAAANTSKGPDVTARSEPELPSSSAR